MNDVQTNDRGEWTDATGKLYHGRDVVHEGPWLNCDGCNPVVVVQIPDRWGTVPQEEATLVDLRDQFAAAKAAETEAKERVKTLSDKLKAALSEATNGALRVSLRVPGTKPLNLTYVESWRLDTPALKAAHPAVYVEFAKRSGSWRLEESRGQ